MAIQFHQEMKDRDYPTKEPVRNPQQSNEQANPMGQLEKENPFPDPIGLTPRQRSALLRRHALHQKYDKAVALYAETNMPLKTIAMECHVSAGGLGSYLRRYWRELVLHRHRIPLEGENPHAVKIMSEGKPNVMSHARYKKAIDACLSLEDIELNVSQIARKHGVEGTGLANFMRIHEPEVIPWREKVRHWLGINDNTHRGATPACTKQYAEAVELYKKTDMTIPEIAGACHVSPSGFKQHLRFYHKNILEQKRKKRSEAQARPEKKRGELSGNGRTYKPSLRTEDKYAKALSLYKDTALTLKEIAERTHVTAEGLRSYLHKWHIDLVRERAGLSGKAEGGLDLRKSKKRMKTVAAKYEKAIGSLRKHPRPIAHAAKEFGLHPETFREYLHKHEPELANRQGMVQTSEGKRMSRQSKEKYAEAIRLYGTTTETLKDIATRLGLTYNSIGGYIRRNHPEVINAHSTLLIEKDEKSVITSK